MALAATEAQRTSDPQVSNADTLTRAWVEALAGRPAAAHARLMKSTPAMSGAWQQGTYSAAAIYAVLAGDEPGMRAAFDPWRPKTARGRYADTFIALFEGAIDIWEGRISAGAAKLRNAEETLDVIGMRIDRAWVLLGAVRLLGVDDAYGRDAADKVLAIAAELGSPTIEALLATMIDASRVAMTSDRPVPSAAPASTPTAPA